jgi:hypothetical protein
LTRADRFNALKKHCPTHSTPEENDLSVISSNVTNGRNLRPLFGYSKKTFENQKQMTMEEGIPLTLLPMYDSQYE